MEHLRAAEATLLRQGRCHRLPPESGRARAGRPESGVRRERADAGLRRRFWPTYIDRRQHRPDRHRFDEELHPARDVDFDGDSTSRTTAAFSARSSSTRIRRSKGVQVSALRDSVRRTRGRRRVRARRPRAGVRADRDDARRASSRPLGYPRLQAAAAGRQRLPRLRARRIHDACRTCQAGRCTCGSTSSGRMPGSTRRSATATITARVRRIVLDVFKTFESGSIQQVIHKMGTRMLAEIPDIAEVHLEANNRTWDDRRAWRGAGRLHRSAPAVRCLGLRLTR